ncbi:hypothetical protein BT93_L0669 [Corymbia citriodora subsp. variegata]|uniref:Calmodulin-binding protein n=1 Tax=Corymbia citriodora subsp. variegata TaxID=360336 RepID=A0A8T0CPH4_CORYI|nr:hypothetical protein BT93_L0669 [Corymbia citriodora subsp. variegata]
MFFDVSNFGNSAGGGFEQKEVVELASIHSPCLASCTGPGLEDIVQGMHSLEDAVQKLKEVVELASVHSPHLARASTKSIARNDARKLQLQLQTKLSLPIFTGNKVEGDGGAHIYVALIDASTGEVVTSGPESSSKLNVVVLEGDFNKDDEDNWTQEEFENHMVKQREGKRPLLTGDLLVTLKEGVGELGELTFTDNSSWNRSKSFRIGLKVASGSCGNTRIREAKTDAFPVKEHRGESYRKHYPPASDDEIWRLEKIAKDGKSRHKLSDAGIHKVEDFLMQLFTDSKKLREILGKSIIQKNWDILVDHAKSCNIDRKLCLYYSDGMRTDGAVFSTDGQLIGLIKDRLYFATHRLSAQEKERGDTIVKKALDNQNDVREFNGETLSGSMQKKNSSPFLTQVFGRYMAPPTSCAPFGPEAPLTNAGSLAEGYNGATASALPVQLQMTNSGNATELSVDDSVCLVMQQPISTGLSNVLIPRGDDGIPTAGSPMQFQGDNFQYAMRSNTIHSLSQMDYTVSGSVLHSEPPSASTSSFQSGSALPHPEGNHGMEDSPSIDIDDILEFNDLSPEIPLFDDDSSVRDQQRWC